MRLTTKGRFAVTAMIDVAMHSGKGPVTLAGVSGRDPSPDAASWWQWWADHSDVQRTSDKPVVTVIDEKEILGDPTLRFNRISGRCCCLAAGTPVWTDRGLMAIEKITVGDRVLAQDIETGGLAYKPVLQTTVRPPTELTTLRCNNETIVCTRAHRFWDSGSCFPKEPTTSFPVWRARGLSRRNSPCMAPHETFSRHSLLAEA